MLEGAQDTGGFRWVQYAEADAVALEIRQGLAVEAERERAVGGASDLAPPAEFDRVSVAAGCKRDAKRVIFLIDDELGNFRLNRQPHVVTNGRIDAAQDFAWPGVDIADGSFSGLEDKRKNPGSQGMKFMWHCLMGGNAARLRTRWGASTRSVGLDPVGAGCREQAWSPFFQMEVIALTTGNVMDAATLIERAPVQNMDRKRMAATVRILLLQLAAISLTTG